MNNPEKRESWPIGTGREFLEERAKERLPALEVKNTVIWANPAFKEAPFRLKLGKPTDLGIFFTAKPEMYPAEKTKRPVIMPEGEAGRSALWGEVIFKDKEGRLYRDVDVKGIGVFVRRYTGGYEVDAVFPKNLYEAQGLMDYDYALRDRNYSEKLLKAGIRTHRVLAIADLEEIIDEKGAKISIEEGRTRILIPKEMHPVIEVRAFGTKERIDYFRNYPSKDDKERAMRALEDAKAIVAQELGKNPEVFYLEEYLGWFAETLGKQVAKIRKLKFYHQYLTVHNITLDCRIVDLDSVCPIGQARLEKETEKKRNVADEELYSDDYNTADNALRLLQLRLSMNGINTSPFLEDTYVLSDMYKAAYQRELAGGNYKTAAAKRKK